MNLSSMFARTMLGAVCGLAMLAAAQVCVCDNCIGVP